MTRAERRHVRHLYSNIFTVKLQHLAEGMWTIKGLSGQTENGGHDPYNTRQEKFQLIFK
jgi:hypothetical protein